MSHLLTAAKIVCLVAIAWLAWQCSEFVGQGRAAVALAPGIVSVEMAAVRADMRAESKAYRVALTKQADLFRTEAAGQIAAAVQTVDNRVAGIEAESISVLRQSAETLRVASGEVEQSGAAARIVLHRVDMGLIEAGQRMDPWTNCVGNGGCYQAQLGASLGSARHALGSVARSAPRIADSLEQSATQSERAARETANFMHNATELAKPLPRWLRIPLQILTPAVPVVVSTMR